MKTPHIKFDYNTPQEGNFLGGTYFGKELEHPYTPIGISKGHATLKEAKKAREESRLLLSLPLQGALRLPGRVVISYENLDSVTGETVRDPRVLGYWDENTGKIIEVKNRDLTAEAYQILREQEKENPELKHYLREKPNNIEGQDSGGTESKN